ncbi:hypothetical protein [Rhodoplanes sp. SY1]|uniref:hypothetical protein n=1 Tax=Rhodoplanes sp. SY1 TaxID=3166646 RepID=UPI0038B642D4
MIAAYLYLMSVAPTWPIGAPPPDLGAGTLVTVILIASAVPMTARLRHRPAWPVWIALLGAPAAWAVAVQLGQILPYVDCGAGLRTSALTAVGAAVLAGAAGVVSWRWGRDRAGTHKRPVLRFVAMTGGLVAFVLLFALLLQLAAGLVLTGCER